MSRASERPIQLSEAFSINHCPLVEFDRSPLDRFALRGFVVADNVELTVLQLLDPNFFQLDGYAVFFGADVKSWRPIPAEHFVARAARLQKVQPSLPKGLRISSMRETATSAGKLFPLLTVRRERMDGDCCYLGSFLGTTQRSVKIRYITPQAVWDTPDTYLLKDITRLDFGGVYETLLARLAKD